MLILELQNKIKNKCHQPTATVHKVGNYNYYSHYLHFLQLMQFGLHCLYIGGRCAG